MNLLQSVEIVVLFLSLKAISFENINMENGNELVDLESVDFDEDVILSEDTFVRDDNNFKGIMRIIIYKNNTNYKIELAKYAKMVRTHSFCKF